MKKKKVLSLKNITKMDYVRHRGYWVRFIRVIDGQQVMIDQKSFPKSKYGKVRKYNSCWDAYGNIIEKSQLKIRFYENVYGKN